MSHKEFKDWETYFLMMNGKSREEPKHTPFDSFNAIATDYKGG